MPHTKVKKAANPNQRTTVPKHRARRTIVRRKRKQVIVTWRVGHEIIGSPSPSVVIKASLLAEAPFWLVLAILLVLLSSGLSPSPTSPMSNLSGTSFFASRALCSDQARSLTRLRRRASLLAPWLSRMASLTLVAMSFRRSGWRSDARDGVRLSDGKIRRASVRSRSSRNWGFVGARGARCEVAKSSAGVMSPSPSPAVQTRISSTSCRRSRAKWRAGFSSRT